jgi:tRNA dimethylallyltransferase
VEIAGRCGAEIVGADAFQVYAGLDVLTAKPSPALLARVPHHLVGEIPLARSFDVGQYREVALEHVRQIEGRGKRALVVGGTGLYIRALTHGLSDLPQGDPALREELDALTLPELQARYAALDPQGYERIDRQNRRRLLRAIEVSLLARVPFSTLRADWRGEPQTPAGAGVLLDRDRAELYRRIDARVARMFEQGVVEEVRAAEAGPTAAHAIGYAEIRDLLAGKMDMAACIAAIRQRTRRYAKRQLTWFRRENIFFTLNLTGKPQTEAADLVVARLTSGRQDGVVS